MTNNKNKMCAFELISKQLMIPEYQRPYEWTKENIYILIEDILSAYNKDKNKSINLGTVILFNNDKEIEIVDGQQRIITISLLFNYFDHNMAIPILKRNIMWTSSSEKNIYNNNILLAEIISKLESNNKIKRNEFYEYMKNKINFYVIWPRTEEESFQLFDGRNSKYKDLTPVDLLKAYHLGLIPKQYPKKSFKRLIKKWDNNMNSYFSINTRIYKNNYIFNDVLFNIYNWSLNKDIRQFVKGDTYLYKGYVVSNDYQYVKYYKSKNNNIFQINKPFKAGTSFFDMVEYYVDMMDRVINKYNYSERIGIDINNENFQYINYLYYNALLLFHDRFGEDIDFFEKATIESYIFKWSMTHRVIREQVSVTSVNSYVLTGGSNFFFECNNALKIDELFKLKLIDKGKKEDVIKNHQSDENVSNLQNIRSRLWDKI